MKLSKPMFLAALMIATLSAPAHAGQHESDVRGALMGNGCLLGIGVGGVYAMTLKEKPNAVDPMIKGAGLIMAGCAGGAALGAAVSPASAEEAPTQEELQNNEQSQEQE